jgi:retron-type reverse transcriptase
VFKFLGLDGGERHLGIPAVRDRVVQQLLLDILQPIFDPPPRKLKAVTRQAMVTDRAAAANRQWRKQRCSFGNMVASMWSIWIFRNALTGWIMT